MNLIDSEKYLSEIVKNHHRKFDYTRFDNLTLGEICFFSRLLTDQLLFMILYRSNLLPIGISEWRAIRKGLRAPTLMQVGASLYESCPKRQLIGVLSDAILETDMITKELRDRLADKPVGRDLILVDQGRKDNLDTLQRLLQVDKISSYRPSKYDSTDIQQDVWVKTFQVYRQQGKDALRQYSGHIRSISPPPIAMHHAEQEFWKKVVLPAWSNNLKRYIEKVLPILNRRTEEIPEHTRQALRNSFERWTAQKRSGEEVPLRVADRVVLRRSSSRVWRKEGERVDLGTSEKADVSAQMFAVLKEAKRHNRWGPRAITAFKYYIEGKTEEEAAKLAGITDKTFRNNIIRLKKIFSSKK